MKMQTNEKLKIIIVDDHEMFRKGIKLLIEMENIGTVIAEAENGQKFLDLLEIHKPDVVLMDIDMPIMNGIIATQKAIEKYPDLKILSLSMFGDEKYYLKMIQAGAIGFILKKSGKLELERSIKEVSEGQCYFSNELLRKIIIDIGVQKQPEREDLSDIIKFSDREMEVIKLLCNGFDTKEIANEISLSNRTVDAYRSKLLTKTGTKNTVNLVIYSIKNNLVKI